MRILTLKKALSIIITISLLMLSLVTTVTAVNDAADLGYSLLITVTDQNGVSKTAFQIGERIYVKLSLNYTGAGRAPVYGLQGELHYDPYVIRNTSVIARNSVQTRNNGDQITYAFLDMTGRGQGDAMLSNIGEVIFEAKSNGTVRLNGDNFILTNRDATQRYIDDSFDVLLTVGTGVKDVTKAALEADITAAENILADCPVSDASYTGIYYPGFWVTSRTAETFQAAIDIAKAVLDNTDATNEEIEEAVILLGSAASEFEGSKIYGPLRYDSMVTVNAVVRDGNGKIAAGFDSQRCRINTSCTIRFEPDQGYEVEYIYINNEQFTGSDIFTIPSVSRDTTVTVTFCKKPPFTDISHTDWFYVSARFVYSNGLFNGTSETEFSPQAAMSRAMLATVLYRMDGQLTVEFSKVYTDVGADSWFNSAVLWASENGIVNGYGDGTFAPNKSITREQIAVMLYRYTKDKSVLPGAYELMLKYSDASDISDYALEAITWAVAKGLLQGNTEYTLNPKGIATRAAVATMLQRYIEILK